MTPVRPMRLVTGLLAVGTLALLISQAARLPGPPGDTIRENAAADRDATALFYTEVDGWPAWPGRPRRTAPGNRPEILREAVPAQELRASDTPHEAEGRAVAAVTP